MTAVVEVRSTPLLSRLLKGGWFFVSFGEYISSRIFPKVTREVRSLLLSDLGNTFPLQTVFVSLFCLFLFFLKKKKNPPLQSALVVESGDSVFRPCFSVCFCEVTLVSERRLFWVCGSHSSYSIGSSLGGLFS